jgi:hypothetical protein
MWQSQACEKTKLNIPEYGEETLQENLLRANPKVNGSHAYHTWKSPRRRRKNRRAV